MRVRSLFQLKACLIEVEVEVEHKKINIDKFSSSGVKAVVIFEAHSEICGLYTFIRSEDLAS